MKSFKLLLYTLIVAVLVELAAVSIINQLQSLADSTDSLEKSAKEDCSFMVEIDINTLPRHSEK